MVPESYATYDLSKKERTKFLLFGGLGLAAVAFLFYHNLILSLILSFLIFPALTPYRSYLAEKRRKELQEQFRDMLYSVAASIATGRQMPEALYEAEQSMRLIYRDHAMIVIELSNIVQRIRTSRESEEELLKDFASRTTLEDIANFVDIYLTCRQTGGDLIKVISTASAVIMDKITIEKEIRTITAQKQFEAKILTVIPLVVVFFLQTASPDYLSVLYEELRGRILMTFALLGIGTSYFWSMRLTRIEI